MNLTAKQANPVTEEKPDYIDLVAHFASAAPPPKRERIRDALADALGSEVPESDYLLKTWERAVDGLVVEFRKMHGIGRLTDKLVKLIQEAIVEAKSNGGWQFDADAPNRAVVSCIVETGRGIKGKFEKVGDLAAFKADQQKRVEEMARARHG